MSEVLRSSSIIAGNTSFKELMSFTVENPNENSFGGGFDDNYAYLFGNSQAPPLPNWGNFESLKSIKSVNKGADDNGEKSGNQPSF